MKGEVIKGKLRKFCKSCNTKLLFENSDGICRKCRIQQFDKSKEQKITLQKFIKNENA